MSTESKTPRIYWFTQNPSDEKNFEVDKAYVSLADYETELARVTASVATYETRAAQMLEELKDRDATIARLEKENEELRNFCICAYCKTKLPKDADTVMLHMQECEKHPLGDALRAEVALKEQLAKCESEWSTMAREADAQVESLRSQLAAVTKEKEEQDAILGWLRVHWPQYLSVAEKAVGATGKEPKL